jgi:hypothetical protein
MSSYGPLCTQFYDLDKPQPPAEALAYYRSRAELCGGTVLEPMCGSGRFLLPLLAAGVRVEGSDAAPAMLAACRRHAARLGLAPVLHEGRMQDLALGRRFALAFVPSGSIGLLEASALGLALARLREHLLPGAALLLELIDDDGASVTTEQEMPARSVRVDEASSITYECRVRPAADGGALDYCGRYRLQRGGQVLAQEDEVLRLWRYRPEVLRAWLRGAGFESVVVHRDAYPSLAQDGCVLVEARAGG